MMNRKWIVKFYRGPYKFIFSVTIGPKAYLLSNDHTESGRSNVTTTNGWSANGHKLQKTIQIFRENSFTRGNEAKLNFKSHFTLAPDILIRIMCLLWLNFTLGVPSQFGCPKKLGVTIL